MGVFMSARQYSVSITGETPLLMRCDNVQWAEVMQKWAKDPANKNASVAGDDRTPAYRWVGCCYFDMGMLCLPADNLMTVLREGGAKMPTGKKGATFKRQTQSGIVVDQSSWVLKTSKGAIKKEQIEMLIDEKDFEKHLEAVESLGFTLFVKRAKIGKNKHIRVRPRFDTWSAKGSVTVFDDEITTEVLENIFKHSGVYSGIGDWRPSSPYAPGSFGKFTSVVKKM
jgi:hypothetical protein